MLDGLRFVPGVDALLNAVLRSEASGAVRQLMPKGASASTANGGEGLTHVLLAMT